MKKNWFLAGSLGLAAALVYFASLADYAFPGESAQLMAYWRGLDVASVPKYPLMAVFAKMLGAGNLIAAICGIVSVMTLYHLVAGFVAWRINGEASAGQRERLSHVAGLVASVVFLLTPAVRSSATHLEPKLFDFTWALLSLALVFPFFRATVNLSWLYAVLSGAMVALGACDSALFVAFLPFYLVLLVRLCLAHGSKPYFPLFLFALSVFVTLMFALDSFGLAGADFLKALSSELKDYYHTPGWIFVLAFATLPFVIALFSSDKAFNEIPGLVQWLFHGALTFVAILAIATPLSPSSLMEPYGIMPVATSAFAACVAGYLLAYWYLLRRQALGVAAGGIFAFVLLVTCTWNLFSFNGESGAFADKVAQKILDDLGDRKWFVSDGTLDSHLQLIAAEKGRELNVIALSRDLDPDYLERLGALITEKQVGGVRNGTLRLSLTLGVLPFVQDWFSTDPTVAKDVAIFGAPDLWYAAGLSPMPEFFFFGADESREPDWSEWKRFDAILEAPKGWGSYHERKVLNPVDRLRYSLRRHLGFVANNRGVWLQDKHRDDDAFKMYELVLKEIDHDNICTIFNEVGMVGAKHPSALAKQRELERLLKEAVDDSNRRYLLWRLGTYYGYIRNPEIFIRLGYAWARSGRPGDALSQIRRAIDFVPTDKRSILLNMMAALYANDNDQNQSRRIYESVLAKDSNNHDALIGMMRLELLSGNGTKALEYLQRAASLSGNDGKRAKIELAMVAMMKGDLAGAKAMVRKAIDIDDKDMQSWSLLAAVTIQQIDAAKDKAQREALKKELEDQVLPRMEKQSRDPHDYYLMSTKGFVLLQKGKEHRRAARDSFVRAAQARPDNAATQDIVLGLDISLDDKQHAEAHAKDVLRRNRNAPLANYVMGSLALARGKNADAEAYLRKAADASQPVPLALNDLAEVLRREKNYAEAERYARKAVKVAPELYVAWETLGAVLMDSGDKSMLDEAEAAVRKACQLSKAKDGKDTDVRMLVSLARVQILRNDMNHAKVTIRKVRARLDELNEFERREFEGISRRVR